ncbi:signal peptidase I [Mollicutes bacterium LVI A0039]|nr:signal peptidase I [Mollicutes bacterium LVI A0039]
MEKKKINTTKIVRELIEWLKAFLAALILVLITMQFVLVAKIDGRSMDPYLVDGQHVVTMRRFTELERDDVIAFDFVNEDGTDEFHVKRIIGVPGDKVTMSGEQIYVNDELVIGNTKVDRGDASYELSDTQYFVVGDNYEISLDSRIHGPIEEDTILGEVVIKLPF